MNIRNQVLERLKASTTKGQGKPAGPLTREEAVAREVPEPEEGLTLQQRMAKQIKATAAAKAKSEDLPIGHLFN